MWHESYPRLREDNERVEKMIAVIALPGNVEGKVDLCSGMFGNKRRVASRQV